MDIAILKQPTFADTRPVGRVDLFGRGGHESVSIQCFYNFRDRVGVFRGGVSSFWARESDRCCLWNTQ
jgi:hypothetical protein